MDISIFLYIILKSALLTTLLFGAFLVYKQLPKNKIKKLFISLLVFWSTLLLFDLCNMYLHPMLSNNHAPEQGRLGLFIGVISQLFILCFFYNLLFTLKQNFKILAIHFAIILMVFGVVWSFSGLGVANYYDGDSTTEEAYSGITSQLILLKSLIVFMQLMFSGAIIFFSNKLVPIYQQYIEQNESNSSYNILWIREVSHIISIITIVYNIAVISITHVSIIIYYIVVIAAYMRMINVLLQHKTLDNFDDLYDKIGVKWSWERFWYVDQTAVDNIHDIKKIYAPIIEWIDCERPYVNPNFSFKEISQQFADINYNDFDAHLKDAKGMNFQAYIRECRIDDAIKILISSKGSILLKEVSFKVGFENNSAFSRAFKVVKGVSASEWRSVINKD